MKVAIYAGTLSRGGAERVAVALAEYLAHHGDEAMLVVNERVDDEYQVPDGVAMASLEARPSKNPVTLILRLRNAVRRYMADVVVVMGTPFGTYAVPACVGLNAKVVISERNSPGNFAGRKLTKLLYTMAMRHADGYVFQTNEAREFYRLANRKPCAVIPNPINERVLPAPFEGERRKTVVAVGRLVEQKNHMMLLGAFAHSSCSENGWSLEIYGEGPLREALEERIAQLGLTGKAYLLGNVSDVLERIHDAGIFVMSSNFEGIPNALMEAMAVGLPCIATDCPCGGSRLLIESGQNGILVPVNDRTAMSKAIAHVMSDRSFAEAIGSEATKVRQRYSLDAIGPQWRRLISEVAGVINNPYHSRALT